MKTHNQTIKLPSVAIIGRPNVGKSTLFNRLAGENIAVVSRWPGTTRDRLICPIVWRGKCFELVDTGGIGIKAKQELERATLNQADQAAAMADLLLFVVDASTGITPIDLNIANKLRALGKPLILVINKIDSAEAEKNIADFHCLGLKDVLEISALSGKKTGDLLDLIIKKLGPFINQLIDETESPKVAIIGRPNVGKSSLINKILNEPRLIADRTAGTTRDAIDVQFLYNNIKINFIDTAGLRRQNKIFSFLERASLTKTKKAINRADLCVLVVDLKKENIVDQDINLANLAIKNGKGLILAINKWDLLKNTSQEKIRKNIFVKMPFFRRIPLVFTSALTGQGLKELLIEISNVWSNLNKKIPTPELNELIHQKYIGFPGMRGKIFYATQTKSNPVVFVIFVNNPKAFGKNFIRFLEKLISAKFGLKGVPLKLILRKRS